MAGQPLDQENHEDTDAAGRAGTSDKHSVNVVCHVAGDVQCARSTKPPLQMRVMTEASDAPNLASAMNIGAFNLGNAIGAALGGAVISAGLGYPAVSTAGAVMAGSGLVLVLILRRGSQTTVAAV